MDIDAASVRARMPLAEASLLVWRHIADPTFLEQLFERDRGRHYTRVLSFPVMVQLVADALLTHGGSGRHELERARAAGRLPASIQAAYGKLRRMPVAVSTTFLAGCTDRLRALYPKPARQSPPGSLADFEVLVLDGKTVKWVHKRLKVARKTPGGVVGGKALVAMALNSGLVLGMHAHPDGDVNEIQFVGDLAPLIRSRVAGPRLWLADRAFGYPTIIDRLSQDDDAFVVRARSGVTFEPDATRPAQAGHDAEGQAITQVWGWLGRAGGPHRAYVRRITLTRAAGDAIHLLSNLLDSAAYPAADLLALYRARWGIERVFQQVTEVFGLRTLIGMSPSATLFQLAFCLLIYNITQVTRAYIAAAQDRPAESISNHRLFDDVQDHLTAWQLFATPAQTVMYLSAFTDAGAVRARLHALLDPLWTDVWIKAPSSKRTARSPPTPAARSHHSLFRLLHPQSPPNPTRKRTLR